MKAHMKTKKRNLLKKPKKLSKTATLDLPGPIPRGRF